MARARTLAELEIEIFKSDLERQYCRTAISCSDCPATNVQMCPANGGMQSTVAQSEQPLMDIERMEEVPVAQDTIHSSAFQFNPVWTEIGLT